MNEHPPQKPLMSQEFRAVFVPAAGTDDFGAADQSAKIAEMIADGWDWQGFISVSGVKQADVSGELRYVGTETAGTILYFKKIKTNVETVLPGEAMMLRGTPSRQVRRAVARERSRVAGRTN